jgi:hypothetical protein
MIHETYRQALSGLLGRVNVKNFECWRATGNCKQGISRREKSYDSISRVSDSCGLGVPLMTLVGERGAMEKWTEGKTWGIWLHTGERKMQGASMGCWGLRGEKSPKAPSLID